MHQNPFSAACLRPRFSSGS